MFSEAGVLGVGWSLMYRELCDQGDPLLAFILRLASSLLPRLSPLDFDDIESRGLEPLLDSVLHIEVQVIVVARVLKIILEIEKSSIFPLEVLQELPDSLYEGVFVDFVHELLECCGPLDVNDIV